MIERSRCYWQVSLSITVLLASEASLAQTASSADSSRERAKALVAEASTLMNAKDFASACPKLEEATTLVPDAIGGKLALGECYVGLERFARAWDQYSRAEALARAKGDARANKALNEMTSLEPRIAKVTIIVPKSVQAVSGLSVTWDNIKQDEATWGRSMRVDKGKHVIEAKAPGRITWNRVVRLNQDDASVVQVVPDLQKVPDKADFWASHDGYRSPALPPVLPIPSTHWPAARKAGYGLLPVGVLGLGIGIATLSYGINLPETNDDQQGKYTAIALTSMGIGGLAATGSILLLQLPTTNVPSPSKTGKHLQWHVGIGPQGIGVQGVW